MSEKNFKIEGMTCQHCVKAVEVELSKIDINNCKIEIGSANVEFDEDKIPESKIIEAIERAGYPVIDT